MKRSMKQRKHLDARRADFDKLSTSGKQGRTRPGSSKKSGGSVKGSRPKK